jgi:hypothetical protein
MAANVVVRIWFSPSSGVNYDSSPTGLEYRADVARHRFGIVCITRVSSLLTNAGQMLERSISLYSPIPRELVPESLAFVD